MKKTGKMIFIGLVLAFLYLPILVLAVYSFTKSTNIGAIRGFSMHNYVTLFSTPELVNMITGTIALALGASALATILGTVGAIGVKYIESDSGSECGCSDRIFYLYLTGSGTWNQQGHIYSAGSRTCDTLCAVCILVGDSEAKTDGFQYL